MDHVKNILFSWLLSSDNQSCTIKLEAVHLFYCLFSIRFTHKINKAANNEKITHHLSTQTSEKLSM